MELYQEILGHALEIGTIPMPNLKVNLPEILELTCYKALSQIKAVLADETLNDQECFAKIEEIVCIFEAMGSGGDSRHDFG